jgi:dihydrofolate reductase
MAPDRSTVTIHMVASLDGFIGKKDGSVSWLETSDSYSKGVVEENADDFMNSIGCFVIGARTYELALTLGWPYGDVPTVVVTHRDLKSERASVEFYSGPLETLVNERLKPRYKNIWLGGGAMLASEFIRLKLADRINVSIVPILLGDGIRFFEQIGSEQTLHLEDVKPYKNGFVELSYEVRRIG